MITRAAVRFNSVTATATATATSYSLQRLSPGLFSSLPPETEKAAGETDGGTRKYERPCTVVWTEGLQNSVNFVGNVQYPLTPIEATKDFGVQTSLRVQKSPYSKTCFWLHLEMWDELAHKAFQHLKPTDYIHVSGQLGTYNKTVRGGEEKIRYKVTVKELNYVKHSEPEVNSQRTVNSESEGQSPMQKHRSRLLLWQVFFANPSEWDDQRKTKKTPKHPDFKHESTGEALWLNDSDPPWVKKQLELLDSRLSAGPRNVVTSEFLSSRSVSD